MKKLPLVVWLSIVTSCVVLDQFTKFLAEKNFQKPLEVFPFFNLVLVYNKGFAFGVWQSSGNLLKFVFYYLIPLLVLTAVAVFFFKVKDNFVKLGLALILGGGIGNLIDRFFYGKVRDFIDFHIGNWHYPAFNVADTCVSLGIIILIWEFLIKEKTKKV